jgi:hypothetical protein
MNAASLWATYLGDVLLVVMALVALAMLAHWCAKDLAPHQDRPALSRAWWMPQSHQFMALCRALRNALAMVGIMACLVAYTALYSAT